MSVVLLFWEKKWVVLQKKEGCIDIIFLIQCNKEHIITLIALQIVSKANVDQDFDSALMHLTVDDVPFILSDLAMIEHSLLWCQIVSYSCGYFDCP